MCLILQLSRSCYYEWLHKKPGHKVWEDFEISRRILALHEQFPAYGLNSIYAVIHRDISCGRNRIRRLMRKFNISSIRQKAFHCTTNSNHAYSIAPNLLMRNFKVDRPNRVWVSDITYIKTDEGWLYTAIVKDLCTRQIVGHACSAKIDTQLVLNALNMAIRREHPPKGLIHHSDRGIQYASNIYRETLAKNHIQCSMSRKGNPYDNAVAENFFSCMKCELLYHRHFRTRFEATSAVFMYIEGFYNTKRVHSALGYLSPLEFKRARFAA
jgi:putative transposase